MVREYVAGVCPIPCFPLNIQAGTRTGRISLSQPAMVKPGRPIIFNNVHSVMRRSSQRLAFSTYSRSRTNLRRTESRSVSGGRLIWASPVIPGNTLLRRRYPGIALASDCVNSGRSGRGPINVIWPMSTLKICGSSSK